MKKDTNPKDRYTGVLLERIESNFEKVLEGHDVLGRKIETVHTEVKDLRKDIDWKFNLVFGELKDLKTGRIAELEKRVQKLENKIAFR